ncbi:MAG TPA: PQQ-binding-like beta-propeller repeat protein [Gemmatales bacterium]|mgnify:CR=1 FL=1|nr:PQQ-binding-like beta-propeller repeat protein [Gemmatales bacterium]HMP60458.1 PQQ-binding-like beta-propeller repeat protein [Gemmatales bacterium]
MRRSWPLWLGFLLAIAGFGLIGYGLPRAQFDYHRLITLMTWARWSIWVLLGLGAALVVLAVAMLAGRLPRTSLLGPLVLLGPAAVFIHLSVQALLLESGTESRDPQLLAQLEGAKLAQPQAADSDWPQWRGPLRDGRATGPLRTDWADQPPREVWRQPIGGGYSSVLYVDGKLYTQDRQPDAERVLCLDPQTGRALWVHAYPVDYATTNYFEGPRATPTFADGRLYVVGATGQFLCLALPTEEGAVPQLLWQHDLVKEFDAPLPQWGIASSPLLVGNLVVVQPGGRKGSIVAFDKVTGQLVWTSGADPSGYSSPIAAEFDQQQQIVAFTGKRMVGLDPADGRELWSFAWSTNFDANIATPIVVENFVFLSSGYNAGCALLEIRRADQTWSAQPAYVQRNRLMRNHHSSCVLVDGFLYGFDCGPNLLTCIDLRKGERRWQTRDFAKGGVLFASGHLIVLTEDGELGLAEANPEKAVPKGKFRVFDAAQVWALPTLVEGRLYLRSNQEIACLDLR